MYIESIAASAEPLFIPQLTIIEPHTEVLICWMWRQRDPDVSTSQLNTAHKLFLADEMDSEDYTEEIVKYLSGEDGQTAGVYEFLISISERLESKTFSPSHKFFGSKLKLAFREYCKYNFITQNRPTTKIRTLDLTEYAATSHGLFLVDISAACDEPELFGRHLEDEAVIVAVNETSNPGPWLQEMTQKEIEAKTGILQGIVSKQLATVREYIKAKKAAK